MRAGCPCPISTRLPREIRLAEYMETKSDEPIFTPGAGLPPPLLAGRGREQAAISRELSALAADRHPSSNIVLVGPRGNGKTALLRWIESKASKRPLKGHIECVQLPARHVRSEADMAHAFKGPGLRFPAEAEVELSAAAAPEGFGRAEGRVRLATKGLGKPPPALEEALRRRCAKRGLAILVDEAHTLDACPRAAQALFNAVQTVAGERRPLLLILAGTPDTGPRLNAVEATFWNRLRKIGIGLLDADASREALRDPLRDRGFGIRSDALARAADEAQRYPYFLQIVGDALHLAALHAPEELEQGGERNPKGCIGSEVLERALADSREARDAYYDDRYDELERRDLVPAAAAVAEEFGALGGDSLPSERLAAAIARAANPALADAARHAGARNAARWAESELRNLGFVWSAPGKGRECEPGIPSFMNYVRDRAPKGPSTPAQRVDDRRAMRQAKREPGPGK